MLPVDSTYASGCLLSWHRVTGHGKSQARMQYKQEEEEEGLHGVFKRLRRNRHQLEK
jgi:hypothetical protein